MNVPHERPRLRAEVVIGHKRDQVPPFPQPTASRRQPQTQDSEGTWQGQPPLGTRGLPREATSELRPEGGPGGGQRGTGLEKLQAAVSEHGCLKHTHTSSQAHIPAHTHSHMHTHAYARVHVYVLTPHAHIHTPYTNTRTHRAGVLCLDSMGCPRTFSALPTTPPSPRSVAIMPACPRRNPGHRRPLQPQLSAVSHAVPRVSPGGLLSGTQEKP